MPDVTTRAAAPATASAPTESDAALAAERFAELSAETRGCAILGPGDRSLAATGDRKAWADAAVALLRAADKAAGGRCSQAHVATEEGETYAVRLGDLAMVAVTDRFTLSSLVLSDLRSTLRGLARPSRAGNTASWNEDAGNSEPANRPQGPGLAGPSPAIEAA